MAIQVRLDLSPSEFDLARRALDAYVVHQTESSEQPASGDRPDGTRFEQSGLRRAARAEAVSAKATP